MTALSTLLFTAAKSVAAALFLFLCAAGFVWIGIADQQFLGKLARLVKNMFLPSLIFTTMSSGMTWQFVQANWMLTIFGILIILVGFIVGHLLAITLRVPMSLHPWYVLAIAIPNMVALPLVLVEALCREEEEVLGRVASCVQEATLRLFSVTLLHTYIFWTLAFSYVRSYSMSTSPSEAVHNDETEGAHLQHVLDEDVQDGKDGVSPAAIGNLCENHGEEVESLNEIEPQGNQASAEQAPPQSKKSALEEILAGLMEPPVIASVAGLLVAWSSSLRWLFFSPNAPLTFLSSALAVAGKASPAVTGFISGGSFGLQLLKFRREDPFGIQALGISGKAMVMLVVGRIIVVPALLMILLLLGLDWFPRDRWSRLILFFQPAGVTANVITMLSQLMDQPQGAQMVALSTIPQMLLYIPTACLFITIGMICNADLA
jgi:hypothetical protein